LSVSDTGSGIPPEILERVFEPFFTTKEPGKGTGLGLASIHGLVKQSGGHIRIYSEVGRGTTIKIYLPRLAAEEKIHAAPSAVPADGPVPRASAGEVVLLVEDNEGVLQHASAMLKELGYDVLDVKDAGLALAVLDREPTARVDILFTDVVLPGKTNGRSLAEEAVKRRPGLPVLFATGYTKNAIIHGGILDAHVQLINKPYTRADVARKLRGMLDARELE